MAGGTIVGLDIGSNLMKVVEMRRGGKGVEVTALGIAETPPDLFDNSVVLDVKAMAAKVKELLKTAGVTAKKCVTSISGQSAVVVRVIEIPKVNTKAELDDAMKFEVERQVPFATGAGAGVITDYVEIVRPEGDNPQFTEVLLAAAQQEVVDRHCEMLQAAGLKPVAIDVEALANGRVLLELAQTSEQPGHTVAIVNIGASVTEISIYRDKMLSFSRTIPTAGDQFTNAIASHLQVDARTAETYKRDYAEVVLDNQGVAQQAFNPTPSVGFVDFSNNQVPTVTTDASPSGRTPFGLDTPMPAGGSSSPSGRMPFDFAQPGQSAAEGQPEGGFFNPVTNPSPEPGFYQPDPQPDAGFNPANPMNTGLPVPVQPTAPTDPARDALRMHIFEAITAQLIDLVQDLRRSIDYYRGRSGDAPIHEVLLIGGSSKLRNLDTFLEMELGIPTRVADPMRNVMVSSKSFSQPRLQEVSSLFPTSIGLGARELIDAPKPVKQTKPKK